MEYPKKSLNDVLTELHGKPKSYSQDALSKLLRPYRNDLVDLGVNTADNRNAKFTEHQKHWIVNCEEAKKVGNPKPTYTPEAQENVELEQTTSPEEVPTPVEVPTSSVAAQTQTKTGKQVKAILKNDKVIPARGSNEFNRGRQASVHRKSLTVSRGKVVNIYLESEFDAAADKVARVTGNNKAEWFKRVINSNSEMNPTAALRIDIVKSLSELVQP